MNRTLTSDTLSFGSLQKGNAGVYICTASNTYAGITKPAIGKITIHVNCKLSPQMTSFIQMYCLELGVSVH